MSTEATTVERRLCRTWLGALAVVACVLAGPAATAARAVSPPTLTASFSPDDIKPGSSTLTFVITNPNDTPLTGVQFALPTTTGTPFETAGPLTIGGVAQGQCAAKAFATPPNNFTFGPTPLDPQSSCTVSIAVTGNRTGSYVVDTTQVTADGGITAPAAEATLTVANPPNVSISFGAQTIPTGGTAPMTVTITNPNVANVAENMAVGFTGVAFSAPLPAGLTVATPSNAPPAACGGTVSASGQQVGLTGGMLAAGQSCTMSVSVAGRTSGVQNVSISASSIEGGTSTVSSQTTASIAVVGPPTVALSIPSTSATYDVGESVDAVYICADDVNGPGIASCTGTVADDAPLDTSTAGSYSFSVTATSRDGQQATQTIGYSVALSRPQNTAAPAISGAAPAVGRQLTCPTGSWSDTPTGFAYSWARDGTPVAGATAAGYTIHRLDLGSTLTCTVTASNAAGAGEPATSKRFAVAVTPAAHCPTASGGITDTAIGRARLELNRAQERGSLSRSAVRRRRDEDVFCLTPVGTEVGYASDSLLARLPAATRTALRGRAVWVSTGAPSYSVRGIRPGATLASAEAKIRHGRTLAAGSAQWYVAPHGIAAVALKAHNGIVVEIALADPRVLRANARALLAAFG